MCGIVFLQGAGANSRLESCLDKIKHRGPDDTQSWHEGEVAIGFTRLSINGEKDFGKQPFQYDDWVGVINGEIYNYQSLVTDYSLFNLISNDTSVILPLYVRIGDLLIDKVDGFYAAVLYNSSTGELVFIRDFVGKKPLFYGMSDGVFFVTSELKAITTIDWFQLVPKGVTRFDLVSKRVMKVINHQLIPFQGNIVTSLTEAVEKRLFDVTRPVGIFLSGGLDSSIITALASKIRSDITYFTLGGAKSTDNLMVTKLVRLLGITNLRVIPLPHPQLLEKYIEKIVYVTESFNPSIVSNGLATYLLAKAAKENGVKVVLTGEGADELFGGYFKYLKPQDYFSSRKQLVDDMHFTELRRLDSCTMAHGVEARCPFLDKSIIALSEDLKFDDIYGENTNKLILRKSFQSYLPPEVINRPKVSFDVGSGVRELVVQFLRRNGRTEREELKSIWLRHFSNRPEDNFFHCYPVFDAAIDRRGKSHL